MFNLELSRKGSESIESYSRYHPLKSHSESEKAIPQGRVREKKLREITIIYSDRLETTHILYDWLGGWGGGGGRGNPATLKRPSIASLRKRLKVKS